MSLEESFKNSLKAALPSLSRFSEKHNAKIGSPTRSSKKASSDSSKKTSASQIVDSLGKVFSFIHSESANGTERMEVSSAQTECSRTPSCPSRTALGPSADVAIESTDYRSATAFSSPSTPQNAAASSVAPAAISVTRSVSSKKRGKKRAERSSDNGNLPHQSAVSKARMNSSTSSHTAALGGSESRKDASLSSSPRCSANQLAGFVASDQCAGTNATTHDERSNSAPPGAAATSSRGPFTRDAGSEESSSLHSSLSNEAPADHQHGDANKSSAQRQALLSPSGTATVSCAVGGGEQSSSLSSTLGDDSVKHPVVRSVEDAKKSVPRKESVEGSSELSSSILTCSDDEKEPEKCTTVSTKSATESTMRMVIVDDSSSSSIESHGDVVPFSSSTADNRSPVSSRTGEKKPLHSRSRARSSSSSSSLSSSSLSVSSSFSAEALSIVERHNISLGDDDNDEESSALLSTQMTDSSEESVQILSKQSGVAKTSSNVSALSSGPYGIRLKPRRRAASKALKLMKKLSRGYVYSNPYDEGTESSDEMDDGDDEKYWNYTVESPFPSDLKPAYYDDPSAWPTLAQLRKIHRMWVRKLGGYQGAGMLRPSALIKCLSLLQMDSESVFIDMGAGPGNVLYWAIGLFKVKKAIGYERYNEICGQGHFTQLMTCAAWPCFGPERFKLVEKNLRAIIALPATTTHVYSPKFFVSFRPPAMWNEYGLKARYLQCLHGLSTTGKQSFSCYLYSYD